MPCARSILIVVWFAAAAAAQDRSEVRMLFTGDILLSREVRHEIEKTGAFPWDGFTDLFRRADWVAGNLEGAVGEPGQCLAGVSQSPCFDIPPGLIPLLSQAGFHALGIANNHALDLGGTGREATHNALRGAGLEALSFEESPAFLKLGSRTIAVGALSTVAARDGSRTEVPSTELRQKLRLARTLADVVVVFIHWGSELLEWPDTRQREAARWLVENGADLIVGHHPHVVQKAECVDRRPVFYSLGNHLFDQKYPATKQGLIADCRIGADSIRCGGIQTETPAGSAFPRLSDGAESDACVVRLTPAMLHARAVEGGYIIEGRDGTRTWRSAVLPLVSAEVGRLKGPDGPGFLLTLERHQSPIDGEDGLRPYVYEVHSGGLIARWRGSALAWPLLDAALLPGGDGLLCALHRRDSFLTLKPGAEGVRVAAYRWNGFGFSGVEDAAVLGPCRRLFGAD